MTGKFAENLPFYILGLLCAVSLASRLALVFR